MVYNFIGELRAKWLGNPYEEWNHGRIIGKYRKINFNG
jgi:hypothetical protein